MKFLLDISAVAALLRGKDEMVRRFGIMVRMILVCPPL